MSDWAFVTVFVEDGFATQADVGYSETRTSEDRCGAALARVKKVDSFVIKMKPVE